MGVPVYKRILDLFEAEGVNTLFGIPDPNFVHMFAEADARGWSVVAPHHELSAGFMAEAVSRMTGKPGLCIGTLGPGMANIAGAIQCALVENSPYSRRIAGVPILTLVGCLAMLGFGAAIGVLLWDPGSGASLSQNPGRVALVAGVYVVGLVGWFVARAIRRAQGVDIDLAYRELPAQ